MVEETKPVKKIKLLKKNLSNIDIFVIANELNEILADGFITNIYEIPSPEGKTLLLKCRSKSGKQNIIIEPKRRINLTQFSYPVPPAPSQFIIALRKFMKGRRIARIYQHNLDRILIFELKSKDGNPWKFIIEFFSGGNYILVDGENLTYMAKSYKKMRDRSILAKRPYDFPPSRGVDIVDLTQDYFSDTLKSSDGEVVRIIARSFNIPGYIAEEICLKANIEKKTNCMVLSENDLVQLYKASQSISKILIEKQFNPHIILNEDKISIGFEPFPFDLFKNYNSEPKSSYNETIDDFFSKFDSESLFSGDVNSSKKVLSKTEKILKQQQEKIKDSHIIKEKSISQGHLIYQYLPEIDNLIQTIMFQKREKNKDWKQIAEILNKGKEQGIKECQIFDKFFVKEVKMQIKIEEFEFKIDLKKNAVQNAQEIYSRAKKARKKIVGAEKALKITKEKIVKQQIQHERIQAQKAFLLKRPKQKWYEKFRWFVSNDNFLIIGGRDASSNEAVVKKHMNKNDLFFHTDVRGASVCLIKNEDKREIPQRTIIETASFAASYSSAWKNGWGNADIFYVHPDQVSKTPKSGEYLKKGSFIINGKKNFLTKPYLGLAIGIKLIPINPKGISKAENEFHEEKEEGSLDLQSDISETEKDQVQIPVHTFDLPEKAQDHRDFIQEMNEDGEEEVQYFPQIISSAISAIKNQTLNYVVIKPSKSGMKTSSLAKKIISIFLENSNDAAKKWIHLVSLDEVIRAIPAGLAIISKKS